MGRAGAPRGELGFAGFLLPAKLVECAVVLLEMSDALENASDVTGLSVLILVTLASAFCSICSSERRLLARYFDGERTVGQGAA